MAFAVAKTWSGLRTSFINLVSRLVSGM